MRERDIKTAKKFGIFEQCKNLENKLLEIEGVSFDANDNGIAIDLDGFYDNLNQIIIVPKYNINVSSEDYFAKRGEMLRQILNVCESFGLTPSGDRIEDYGAHYYIVRNCNWKKEEQK